MEEKVREIEGYYYDKEKKKYFIIPKQAPQPHQTQQQIVYQSHVARRKAENNSKNKNYSNYRRKIEQQYQNNNNNNNNVRNTNNNNKNKRNDLIEENNSKKRQKTSNIEQISNLTQFFQREYQFSSLPSLKDHNIQKLLLSNQKNEKNKFNTINNANLSLNSQIKEVEMKINKLTGNILVRNLQSVNKQIQIQQTNIFQSQINNFEEKKNLPSHFSHPLFYSYLYSELPRNIFNLTDDYFHSFLPTSLPSFPFFLFILFIYLLIYIIIIFIIIIIIIIINLHNKKIKII